MNSTKNKIISTLLQYYKLNNTKYVYKPLKVSGNYNVDTGVFEIDSSDKTIKNKREFLETLLHELYHAMDAKKYGAKKFKKMYEIEQNKISQGWYKNKTDPYWDNEYEEKARDFAKKNYSKWKNELK